MHRNTTESAVDSSPFETYLREINEVPLLTADQEKSLAKRIGDGDAKAREHMVRANLRLVVNVALSFQGRGLSLEDLIEEGNLGLLRAAEGFDPSMNTRFSTYASYWIKQSIRRGIINSGKTVRLPVHMVELLGKWNQKSIELENTRNRKPSIQEVAKALKLRPRQIEAIQRAIQTHDASMVDIDLDSGESIEDADQPPADVELIRQESVRKVHGLVGQLKGREKAIVIMRFPLDGSEEGKTLKQTGEKMDLTKERVRQIEKETLLKMQIKCETDPANLTVLEKQLVALQQKKPPKVNGKHKNRKHKA